MDGEIAARVRAVVGPDIPIGMAPDMHANLSQKLVDNVTATVVYRTNPHLDPRQRGLECAEIIVRTINGEVHPVQALEMPPEEALTAAIAAPRGPVVLMDVGDNIGGGSPGDSTVLLEAAKRLGVRSYLQTLRDPEAVSACLAAGVGARISLEVRAKTDDLHGRPVAVTGTVRCISDGCDLRTSTWWWRKGLSRLARRTSPSPRRWCWSTRLA
jgi:microcystin degradation protein MlrC